MPNRSYDSVLGKGVFSKALITHLQKCINSQESPPKSKHVRAIIIETHQQKTSSFLYTAVGEMQIFKNPIVCWKYLILIHKVMRSGCREAVHYTPRKISTFEDIKRTWVAFRCQYSSLISQLCCVIIRKLGFHRAFANIPGDFEISQQEIMLTIGKTPESLNAFSDALLDYLDSLLTFQSLVLDSIDRSGTVSPLPNNCRLAALTQCVQDCAALYDLSLKTLIRLHALLPPESLASSRKRFNRLFNLLARFFVQANTFSYLRDILKIPLLPSSPPNFFDSVSPIQNIEVTEMPEKDITDSLVDLTTPENQTVNDGLWKGADADDAFGLSPGTCSSDTAPVKDNMLEVNALRAEIQRLQIEKSVAQDQLCERVRTMENEIKSLVDVKSRQDEQLLQLIDEVKSQTAVAAATEEKFVKFRDAYGKLRGEHVALLKRMESAESANDTKQRMAQLELEQVSWQDARRQLEAQLAEVQLALETAESKIVSLTDQLEGARKVTERETRDILLKAACLKAKQDTNATTALMDSSDFVQCRSCVDVINSFTKDATAEVKGLKEILSDKDSTDSAKLPLKIAHLSSYLNANALHAKAIANSAADITKSDELMVHSRRILSDGVEIYSHLVNSADLEGWRMTALFSHMESVNTALSRIQTLAEELRPQIKDINEEDLELALEQEIQHTAELIAQAESRFKELLEQSRKTMTGIQLEVHGKILSSCTELMSAIALLVARARELQSEIATEGKGASTVKEFYKRHSRWTEGLFSAAKSVGAGANLLVESADAIVSNRGGQLERLMVAALEISGSTTQLLVASRVKATEGSWCLTNLENAAKVVSRVTGEVVANVRDASSATERSQNTEFAQLSYTQAHKAEVDAQVRVFELEAQLVAQRKRLAEMRRFNYSHAAEFELES